MSLGGKREGAGRKKGFAALEAERQRVMVAEKLVTEFEPIVDKAIAQAKEGFKDAREWLTEQAYGKVKSSLELSGPNGKDLLPSAKSLAKADKALKSFLHARSPKNPK